MTPGETIRGRVAVRVPRGGPFPSAYRGAFALRRRALESSHASGLAWTPRARHPIRWTVPVSTLFWQGLRRGGMAQKDLLMAPFEACSIGDC